MFSVNYSDLLLSKNKCAFQTVSLLIRSRQLHDVAWVSLLLTLNIFTPCSNVSIVIFVLRFNIMTRT